MIYTVTFNPSLDYIVTVPAYQTGVTNRTDSELILPGGKGINVSIMLNHLGIANTALGFVAGFTGDEICKRVSDLGIHADFITIDQGLSRINVKIKNIDGMEINGMGPTIPAEKISELMTILDTLKEGDYLVLAGSIPSSMPSDIYSKIMARLEGRNIRIIVDATKDLLLNVLTYHPFLIKPNNHELGELFGVTISSREEAIPYARRLQEKGAGNVLVSMAGQGAVLVTEDGQTFQSPAPEGELRNAVGAGDSMVAGFLTGYMSDHSYESAFYTGLAAGSASAFSDQFASQEEVLNLRSQIMN